MNTAHSRAALDPNEKARMLDTNEPWVARERWVRRNPVA